jgi:Glycosyl transferase family 2
MSAFDYADLLIIDDIMPSDFSPFRTIEYAHHLEFFNARLLSLEGWHTWIGNENFDDLLVKLPIPEQLKSRVGKFRLHAQMPAKLAYVTFIGNAIRLVPYFEARNLPFVLQLYPGGGFAIDHPEGDETLRRVLLSPMCRKVIVTQTITERYIIEKIGIDPGKVQSIFGGVFESRLPLDTYKAKRYYPADKDTLDLCFVAHKYAGDLVSKGYDRFVAIGLALAARFPHLRMHVVGDYTPADVSLGDYGDRFTFYGRKHSAFFDTFYPRMDAIVSINTPFVLAPGAFDGFPTGACIEAGLRGVLNCLNDPLALNPCFTHEKDIVLLNFDNERSVDILGALLQEPERLYEIAARGAQKFDDVFDTDRQLWARSRIIAEELARDSFLVIRPSPPPSTLDVSVYDAAMAPLRARILELEHRSVDAAPATAGEQAAADHGLHEHVAYLQASLRAIETSSSWRITAPLRNFLVRRPFVARTMRRTAKALWWTITFQLWARLKARRQAASLQTPLSQALLPDRSGETAGLPLVAGPVDHSAAPTNEAAAELDNQLGQLSLRTANLELALADVRMRWAFLQGAIEGSHERAEALARDRSTEAFRAVFKKKKPLVSICVATADRAELLLERCLPSLLNQTYTHLQIVVVGDHCTDDTERRMAELTDDRVTFVNLSERGPYPEERIARWQVAGTNAMNAALALCEGDFITHLDDDDAHSPDRIEKLLAFCMRNEAEFCWHPFMAEDASGNWSKAGNGDFIEGQMTTGSVFYHRYFARVPWDVAAHRLYEPGDWNRFRKIKAMGAKTQFVDDVLLHHYREALYRDVETDLIGGGKDV